MRKTDFRQLIRTAVSIRKEVERERLYLNSLCLRKEKAVVNTEKVKWISFQILKILYL